jgi:hypothetical protein
MSLCFSCQRWGCLYWPTRRKPLHASVAFAEQNLDTIIFVVFVLANLYFAGSENHGSAPHRTINKPFSKSHHVWKNECWQGLLRDSVEIVQWF